MLLFLATSLKLEHHEKVIRWMAETIILVKLQSAMNRLMMIIVCAHHCSVLCFCEKNCKLPLIC